MVGYGYFLELPIYGIFVHLNLDSVPLFVGMRERSIVAID